MKTMPFRTRFIIFASSVLFSLMTFAGYNPIPAIASPAEPEGYRMGNYRAETPSSLSGATVLNTEQAHEIWLEKRAQFVDVLPNPPKPKELPEGTLWREKRRDSIPGSVWLPNVGFGALNPETENYFRDNLARITEGEPGRPLVIFCQASCWMSWNAAKRAMSFGYTKIYWYPEGTDGWADRGWPLERVYPVPMEAPATN